MLFNFYSFGSNYSLTMEGDILKTIFLLTVILIFSLISCNNSTEPASSDFNGKWVVWLVGNYSLMDTVTIKTTEKSIKYYGEMYNGNFTDGCFIGNSNVPDTMKINRLNDSLYGTICFRQNNSGKITWFSLDITGHRFKN